jgi:hypothetical protein
MTMHRFRRRRKLHPKGTALAKDVGGMAESGRSRTATAYATPSRFLTARSIQLASGGRVDVAKVLEKYPYDLAIGTLLPQPPGQ